MGGNGPDESVMQGFLTGTMAPEERRCFEEHLAAEPELFEALAAFEDDLILSFVKGELGKETARRFKRTYHASPARWHRVEETRQLVRALGPQRRSLGEALAVFFASQTAWMRVALAPAAILCLAWMALAMLQILHLRARLAQTASTPASGSAPVALVFAPPAETQRGLGAEIRPLHVAGYAWVILRIEIPTTTPFVSYRAALRALEGAERENVGSLDATRSPAGTKIEIAIPTREMPRGDYVVRVEGRSANGEWQELASRAFRVDR